MAFLKLDNELAEGTETPATNADVRVELVQEQGHKTDPAYVTVYQGGRVVARIIARVEPKQGADGGWYHCVTLEMEERK